MPRGCQKKGGMRVPFRFKMQKVLDYREQLEEEAKVNLAIQRARLAEAQDRLDKIKSELRQAEDRLVGAVLMDAAERWVLEQYVKGLRADAAHRTGSARRDRAQTTRRRQRTSAGRESQAARMGGARRLRDKRYE